MRETGPRAFTLVELLAVMAIIAIVGSLVGMALVRVQQKARQTKCAGNLAAMGKAVIALAIEGDGRIVAYDEDGDGDTREDTWFANVLAYLAEDPGKRRMDFSDPDSPRLPAQESCFRCPSDEEYLFSANRLSYGLNCDVRYHAEKDTFLGSGSPSARRGATYTYARLTGYQSDRSDEHDHRNCWRNDASSPTKADRQAETYRMTEIVNPAQFILLADSGPISMGGSDPTDRTYRSWIRPRTLEVNPSVPPAPEPIHLAETPRPISGIHEGEANILYADGHVEAQDFSMYSPACDRHATDDESWFKLWSLENE